VLQKVVQVGPEERGREEEERQLEGEEQLVLE